MMLRHAVLSLLTILGSAMVALGQEAVPIVVDADLALPAERALADLEKALAARGLKFERLKTVPEKGPSAIVVGQRGHSMNVDRLLEKHQVGLSKEPESLCVQRLQSGTRHLLLIAGADPRGLSYALLDVARTVETTPPAGDFAILGSVETPFLRERAMSVHLFNKDLEEPWYFDENYWRGYFTMLARDRYNQFTLTFSDQTNYLTPIYAYLVEVPGFANVRIKGVKDIEHRKRNLAMLKRIAELAQERGLDFNLGIWAQAPVANYPSAILVENLPSDPEKLAEYSAAGLKLILQACPAITDVQFRMNSESGVSEKLQTMFFQAMFKALREVGRRIKVDLRFKGLLASTIQAAIDAGLDVAVSIKFWCEHMGLPYHPTVADRKYRESRYSYGAMLAKPRNYRVIYQLWSMGSQRLFLWGDPEYAKRFAESCQLGGGEGFEVYAPLTNMGYGGEAGAWRIFADKAYDVGAWDYQRYWFFYLSFGRLGYNPRTDPGVWRREFRHRFGAAATNVENAYRSASQIIPLLTATHLPSASEWWWWPEMDTGGRLREYQRVQPSDTAQFYAIRSWQRKEKWVWEDWDATIPGYVEDAIAGRVGGKMTPFAISQKLLALAEQTEQHLAQNPGSMSAEMRGTRLDLQVLAHLARFHAEKMRAATHLAFFDLTQEAGRLPEAQKHLRVAAEAWLKIVNLTDGVYHDNLAFGIPKLNSRSRGGQHHTGHWKDRLVEIEEDLALLEMLVKKHDGAGKKFRTFPGESAHASEPTIRLTSLANAKPGVDLPIELTLLTKTPLKRVVLHYRPLDQTADWKQTPMTRGAETWQATISGKEILERWDTMIYVEVQYEAGGGFVWPSWEVQTPYVVIPVGRTAR